MSHPTLTRIVPGLVLATVLAQPVSLHAAGLYKTTAGDGTVTYSDRPQPVAPEAPTTEAARPPVPSREPTAKPGGATADDVLELSGVRPQLAAAPAKMAGEFKPRGVRLHADDAAALEHILARHFDADRLWAQVRAEFKRRVDSRKLVDVAEWLRSPLGQKITALEVAAGLESDAAQRALAFTPSGRGGPPPARVALMERIDWTAGITDGSLESMLAVARAMAMARNRALPAEERQTTAQVERHIQQLRGQARSRLAQNTLVFMLYQYRSLSDDELQQYGDFLASDAGRWFSATMSKAMNRTVAAAAQRAASELIRTIPPPRWSGGAAASPRH